MDPTGYYRRVSFECAVLVAMAIGMDYKDTVGCFESRCCDCKGGPTSVEAQMVDDAVTPEDYCVVASG
jgi:hypothetical protein